MKKAVNSNNDFPVLAHDASEYVPELRGNLDDLLKFSDYYGQNTTLGYDGGRLAIAVKKDGDYYGNTAYGLGIYGVDDKEYFVF